MKESSISGFRFVALLLITVTLGEGEGAPRELLQEIRDESFSVQSESELQDAFSSLSTNQRITIAARNILLTETLIITAAGITIKGSRDQRTVIRCPQGDSGGALVVREGGVRIQSVEFRGCVRHSAVVIEGKPGNRTDARLEVEFRNVIFTENGRAGEFVQGAAVRTVVCQEESCARPVLRFIDCRFVRNRGVYGGAVFTEDADLTARRSSFLQNQADLAGGALYINNSRPATVRIKDSQFDDNVAFGDRRLHMTEEMALLTTRNRTLSTVGMGGALFAQSVLSMTVEGSSFANNTGCRGGGAMSINLADFASVANPTFSFTVSDSIFKRNRAYCQLDPNQFRNGFGRLFSNRGGALQYKASNDINITWTVSASHFVGNEGMSGGGIYVESVLLSAAQHVIKSCTFRDNTVLINGGGLMSDAARVKVMSTHFTNCTAVFGGGLDVWTTASLEVAQDPDNTTLSRIEGCTAIYGGGLFADSSGPLTMSSLVIRNNTARRFGGGIMVHSIGGFPVTLRGVTIEDNQALVAGGMAIDSVMNVTIMADGDRKTVFRNNNASSGGGLYFEPGHGIFIALLIENTVFIQNRALSMDTPQMARLAENGGSFNPLPDTGVSVPSLDQGGALSLLSFFSRIPEGHGGGIGITVVDIRLFTIAEIIFANVTIEENEAIVGGLPPYLLTYLYWNRGDRTSCFPAAFGLDTCQRFVLSNVNVTRNSAMYAGGIYSTLPDGISLSCGRNNKTQIKSADLLPQQGHDQLAQHCASVGNNVVSDGLEIGGADAGTRAVRLFPQDWNGGALEQVASGEPLILKSCDPDDEACMPFLRIAVMDVFNQTIVRGIDDADLALTLISDAISGSLRYTAESGVAIINNTFARGINISSTLQIVSEHDRTVQFSLNFSTRGCYPGESIQVDVCSVCPQDQYGFDPHRYCEVCESKANCTGGAALVPQNGYWHSTPYSPVLRQCVPRSACNYEGRSDNLSAFYEDADRLQRDLRALNVYLDGNMAEAPEFPLYEQCADGHEGILCGSCRDGFGHSFTGTCEECPEGGATKGVYVLVMIGWLFVLIGANCVITLLSMNARVQLVHHELRTLTVNRRPVLERSPPILKNQKRSVRSSVRSAISRESSVSTGAQDHALLAEQLIATVQLTETLKILMNYLQVTSAALHLQTNWSALLDGLLSAEASLVGLSSELLSAPFECNFDHDGDVPASISAIWMRLAIPWIILSALLLVFAIVWNIVKFHRGCDNDRPFTGKQFRTCVVVITIVAAYFTFIDTVRELLRAVNCVEIDQAEEHVLSTHPYINYSIEAVEQKVWAEDTVVVCYEGTHLPVGIVGFVGLFLCFCGVVWIIVWLPLNSKRVTETDFVARYWFLYQAYRKEWYTVSWESTILTRKALIAAIVVFSGHLSPSLQAAMCAGVLVICYIVHTAFSPFKIPDDHAYVPEYSGNIFRTLKLPKVVPNWVKLNNSIHLNGLESASLFSSIIIFYSAIILHDNNSSGVGRNAMVAFTFTVNVLFVLYILYRLYAGVHVLLDLKLELNDPTFIGTHENGMGCLNLAKKARALIHSKLTTVDEEIEPSDSNQAEIIPENENGRPQDSV